MWRDRFVDAGALLGFADPRLVNHQLRHSSLRPEWARAFAQWVKQKSSELTLGAKAVSRDSVELSIVGSLECGAWPFRPADAIPLGMELPKGHKACFFRVHIANIGAADLTVTDRAGGLTIGGKQAEWKLATSAGDQPDLHQRGVERGTEIRYVPRIDETVPPKAGIQLIVTAFLPDAAARSKDPVLFGAPGGILLRVR
jgi:hypothetical protein